MRVLCLRDCSFLKFPCFSSSRFLFVSLFILLSFSSCYFISCFGAFRLLRHILLLLPLPLSVFFYFYFPFSCTASSTSSLPSNGNDPRPVTRHFSSVRCGAYFLYLSQGSHNVTAAIPTGVSPAFTAALIGQGSTHSVE